MSDCPGLATISAHRTGAVVTYLHELLVDQLDTTQTWWSQQFNLRLNQEIERNLGHEQAWSGSSRVSDRRPDIGQTEIVRRIDMLQSMAEDIVEDVIYPRSAT